MKVFSNLTSELAELIRGGAVGILPTDTVYGLVCSAADQYAVDKVYKLKPRESKPGTLIASSIDQLVLLGFKRRYLKAVEQFWPGSVSIIIPAGQELEYLHLGRGSCPVRIPAEEKLRNFLSNTGPLLTTSANKPGGPTANNINEAKKYFGDKVDFYVDGGDLSGRPPSTIIRIIDDAIEIIRQGAIKIDETGKIEQGPDK